MNNIYAILFIFQFKIGWYNPALLQVQMAARFSGINPNC